jgi:shikimate kinase
MKGLIFLVGMPGSGKSTIGRLLASQLQMPFIDLDLVIEAMASKSVAAIFKGQGEDQFRELETQALRQVIAENSSGVIATGGGTPIFHDGMKLMNLHGTTIYLEVSLDELINRNQLSDHRPLLVDEVQESLKALNKQRRPTYLQASHHINCGTDDAATIADKIIASISE